MANDQKQIFTVINGKERPAISIKGYVGGYRTNSEDLYNAIKKMEKENVTDCDLLINSGGGSTMDGFTIGEYLEGSTINFHGMVVGMAASMAGVILQFCTTRESYKYARIMTHKVKGSTHGEAEQIRAYADLVEQEETKIVSKFIERTGKDQKTVLGWMKSGVDFWMDANKALENNLIDAIIDNGKKIETSNEATPQELLNSYEENYAFAVANYTENEQDLTTNTNMKNQLIAVLAVAGVVEANSNPTDETIMGEVKALIEKANRTQTAETALETFKKDQAQVLVANALKEGKITAAEKEQFLLDAVENHALVAKSLARMAGKVNPNNGLQRDIDDPNNADLPEIMKGREKWTFNEWQEKAPEDLTTLSEKHTEAFNKLFNTQYPS